MHTNVQPHQVISTRLGSRPEGPFDLWQRQIAAGIERECAPRWVVWWGTWSRRFFAVPTWMGASVSIVEGRTVSELRDAMTVTEIGGLPAHTPSGQWGAR